MLFRSEEAARGFNNGNDFEFIELMNISRTQTVDLTGVKLEDAVAFDFSSVAPALRLLPPGGRIVVVENAAAFAARLEPGALPVIAGSFAGNLSNGGEQIIVRAADGSLIRRFTYSDSFPWPVEADGAGSSLVLRDPAANPDHNLASSWRASTPRAVVAQKAPPPAPQIATQPVGRSVLLGGEVTLAVSASGTGSLWYQWLKDGAPVEGATKATLALGEIGRAHV